MTNKYHSFTEQNVTFEYFGNFLIRVSGINSDYQLVSLISHFQAYRFTDPSEKPCHVRGLSPTDKAQMDWLVKQDEITHVLWKDSVS